MNYYLHVLRNYTVFKGRAGRAEYWWFALISALIIFGLRLVDNGGLNEAADLGIFSSVYLILTLVPTIAVTVRRLHDVGYSGWWFLVLTLIPIVGQLIIFFLTLTPGNTESNKFGAPPKKLTTA